jgi:hypothetical protein
MTVESVVGAAMAGAATPMDSAIAAGARAAVIRTDARIGDEPRSIKELNKSRLR